MRRSFTLYTNLEGCVATVPDGILEEVIGLKQDIARHHYLETHRYAEMYTSLARYDSEQS